MVGLCIYGLYGLSEYKIVQFNFRGTNNFSHCVPDNDGNAREGYSMKVFTLPREINRNCYFHTVSMRTLSNSWIHNKNNKVFLHGVSFGKDDYIFYFFFCQAKPSQCRLNVVNSPIRYHPLSKPVHRYVSFKLKSNIYNMVWYGTDVRGDRYDINQDKYYENYLILPHFIEDLGSRSITNISTNVNESYAVLATEFYMIMFTEENGFENKGDAPKLHRSDHGYSKSGLFENKLVT